MTNIINTITNIFTNKIIDDEYDEYDNIIVDNKPLIPYGYFYLYLDANIYNLEQIHNILPSHMNLTIKEFTLELPNMIYGNSNILNLNPYKNLKIFKINNTNLIEIPFFPSILTHVDISKSNFSKLENLVHLINLKILNCSLNYLNNNDWDRTDNLLPINIINLDLTKCNLENINLTHLKNLTILKINYNYITNLNLESNTQLEILECEKNDLEYLILPDNLKLLKCSNNNLKYFDKLSNKLIFFDCSHNHLTNLDNLPPQLKILNCSYNPIVNLDNLPIKLEKLILCFNKYITNFDNLPDSLIKLIISSSKINQLNNLPSKLKYLFIYNLEELENLECLPNSLNKLQIFGKTKFNKITNIPNNIKQILMIQKIIKTYTI